MARLTGFASASIWDQRARLELLTRLERLAADTPARWGRFTGAGMLAHLNDSLRMALGELTPREKQLPLRFFPLKQLVIYLLPFPRGTPTAPELIARIHVAVWSDEVETFRELLGRLAAQADATTWPRHPAFGAMNRRRWGVLVYRHTDHHFTQFGA
jgi:hypothetical protein